MKKKFEKYFGRIIIVGKTNGENPFVIYTITARSEASKSRKFVVDENKKEMFVTPTDEEKIKSGNLELLIYTAISWKKNLIVSNGNQTSSLIESEKNNSTPKEILVDGLKNWTYENDIPNFTPRISACINESQCAINILKRNETGKEERKFFDIKLENGKSYFISTYSGENENTLVSFNGAPKEINLISSTPKNLCEEFFETLNLQYRVSTSCIMMNRETKTFEPFLINK